MRLPRLAIENHQFTIIVVLLLTVMGVVSFINMPRSEDPAVTPAGASVIIIYPGVRPSDIEQLVVDPLERVLNELDDIKEIKSVAEDGLGSVGVEFLAGSDPDEKYADVLQKVNSIRSQLPEDIFSLEIFKWSITDVNILQIALVSSAADYIQLQDEADALQSLLESSVGVHRAEIWACPQREVRVAVDLAQMAQYRLSMNQVLGALASANQNLPGGYLDIGRKRFNLTT
ncbi:MAG: efflux RND transporter permease subunit, partial [Calditrichaeota bacterium]